MAGTTKLNATGLLLLLLLAVLVAANDGQKGFYYFFSSPDHYVNPLFQLLVVRNRSWTILWYPAGPWPAVVTVFPSPR